MVEAGAVLPSNNEMDRVIHAVLSVIGISLIPNVLLYFIPTSFLTSTSRLNVMKIMMTFASGGLLGDVFLHLLPDLLGNEEHHERHEHHHDHHDHHHDHHDHHDHSAENHDHHHSSHSLYIGLYILAGYLLFFMSQRLLQRHMSDNHSHNNNETTQITRSRSNSKSKSKSKSKNNSKKSESKSKTNVFFESFMKLSSMAWLNIIADCMHNFTDGLALGGIGGTPTILAILFHEIPHEIGDFTILMDSGLSKFEAIRTQFVTAISAVIGTLVGLYLTSHNIESNKINRDILSGLTGGGFLYIATTMMPTGSHNVNIEQILYEASSFTLGVLFMVMVTKLE